MLKVPEKQENELMLFLIENLQNQNRMHLERNEIYSEIIKKLPESSLQQKILLDLQKLTKEKNKIDDLFGLIQTSLIRHISNKQKSESFSFLQSLEVHDSQQSECFYQRSIKDWQSIQQSNVKDQKSLQNQDKALSANNEDCLKFEFFGNIALPYSRKYPYKLNKHLYYFKKYLKENKIQTKFFTIEFILMHWVEYFYFANSQFPTNKEIKKRLQQMGIAQFDIHSFVHQFKQKNQEFFASLNYQISLKKL